MAPPKRKRLLYHHRRPRDVTPHEQACFDLAESLSSAATYFPEHLQYLLSLEKTWSIPVNFGLLDLVDRSGWGSVVRWVIRICDQNSLPIQITADALYLALVYGHVRICLGTKGYTTPCGSSHELGSSSSEASTVNVPELSLLIPTCLILVCKVHEVPLPSVETVNRWVGASGRTLSKNVIDLEVDILNTLQWRISAVIPTPISFLYSIMEGSCMRFDDIELVLPSTLAFVEVALADIDLLGAFPADLLCLSALNIACAQLSRPDIFEFAYSHLLVCTHWSKKRKVLFKTCLRRFARMLQRLGSRK